MTDTDWCARGYLNWSSALPIPESVEAICLIDSHGRALIQELINGQCVVAAVIHQQIPTEAIIPQVQGVIGSDVVAVMARPVQKWELQIFEDVVPRA